LIIGAVIFAAVEVIAAILTTGGTMQASRSFFVAGRTLRCRSTGGCIC
jgi:hypothetical protein